MKPDLNPPMDPRRRFLLLLTGVTLFLTVLAILPHTKKITTKEESFASTTVPAQAIKKAVISQLPYATTGFTIEYLGSSETFVISLTDPKTKAEALDWLSSRGLTQNNASIIINSFHRSF